jgi:hypothetical protein
MKKKVIVLTMLITLCAIFAGTLTSCTRSLDKYWDARLEGGVVRIYGLTREGKKQETLFLPEYIAGYKVSLLERHVTYPATVPSAPLYGNVKYITIEGKVTIGERFFWSAGYSIVEFLSAEPPTIKGVFSNETTLFIVPDGSPEDYLKIEGSMGYRLSFWKSETIDGYLIKDNVYMGYFGKENDLIIPEGVTKLNTSGIWRRIGNYFNSVKIPFTVMYIQKNNMFNDYPGTIYISENTVIEDDAFTERVQIIRY